MCQVHGLCALMVPNWYNVTQHALFACQLQFSLGWVIVQSML